MTTSLPRYVLVLVSITRLTDKTRCTGVAHWWIYDSKVNRLGSYFGYIVPYTL